MTTAGFEPTRAKLSGFQIHPINHSGTLSYNNVFKINTLGTYVPNHVTATGFEPARAKAQYLSKVPR